MLGNRSKFTLFQSHLDLAHGQWEKIILPGDHVIDATCGHGHDTLFLAQVALANNALGKVYGFDIQSEAIVSTQNRLSEGLNANQLNHIELRQQSHEVFPEDIKDKSIKLIVYNLGYLPRANKELTTLSSTTLISIKNALQLICPGGVISVTCYPGHAEGANEEKNLLDFAQSLSPHEWSCTHLQWLNRRLSPSLLLIQARLGTF